MDKVVVDAFKQGQAAYYEGVYKNPYIENTLKYFEFKAGYEWMKAYFA